MIQVDSNCGPHVIGVRVADPLWRVQHSSWYRTTPHGCNRNRKRNLRTLSRNFITQQICNAKKGRRMG